MPIGRAEGPDDLVALLVRTPPHLFAVADGALHADLPGALGQAGLSARPLYSGAMAPVGPHLVPLSGRPSIEALVAILGERAMAVVWSWPEGDADAIFAHLRRLGRIEVPRSEADDSGEEVERVVFRHADPGALMKVLPVLDEAQRAAFMGEARGLVFLHRDRAGRARLVRVPRDGRVLTGGV